MGHTKFYCAGSTKAAEIASQALQRAGISFARAPDASVTDLLLDIPSFDSSGLLRDGEDPDALFDRLPGEITLWGGNLDGAAFAHKMDLLRDPQYLAENASITADCALKLAAPLLDTTWKLSRVLVIGWGRIGKQLAKLLKLLGASVTVCARKASDRALLRAFGYTAAEPGLLAELQEPFDVIFNTAPVPMMDCGRLPNARRCIPVDLASQQGLFGENVILAKGLPGKMAPRASGDLIAERILALRKGGD